MSVLALLNLLAQEVPDKDLADEVMSKPIKGYCIMPGGLVCLLSMGWDVSGPMLAV